MGYGLFAMDTGNMGMMYPGTQQTCSMNFIMKK